MRKYPFPLAAVLVVIFALSSHAAPKPRPAQGKQNQPKKVWTNADMDDLRAGGLISVVGQEVSEAAQPAPAPSAEVALAPAAPEFPVYASRLDDPEWYAEQAANLQAELDQALADLQQQRQAIALAADRVTQPGLNMYEGNVGVTPAAGVAILQQRVQEIQDQLDELSELARQHDIQPGVLGG